MVSTLTLTQVAEKAGNEPLSYIFDAPVHYIVLNRRDNLFDYDFIVKYMAILDEIEATTGPGVLVTFGTGNKHFSTGFDLSWWCISYENQAKSVALFN